MWRENNWILPALSGKWNVWTQRHVDDIRVIATQCKRRGSFILT